MIGHYFTFMTPAAFVRRPGRWIREMARKPGDTGGAISAAPELRVRPRRGARSAQATASRRWTCPTSRPSSTAASRSRRPRCAGSTRRSARTASSPRPIKPSYGLAEATLFVSTTPMGEPPKIIHVDRDELNKHRFVEVLDGRAERRRAGRRPARSASPSGPSSSTPTPPPSCPTVRSARSGCTARTWASATGASRRKPSRPSRTSSSRGPARRTPRAPPTTAPGCAPATTAPSTTVTCTSPAASRTW